jgi:hypothetical protein
MSVNLTTIKPDATISILGSPWNVYIGNKDIFPHLAEVDGYEDSSIRAIFVDECKVDATDTSKKADLQRYQAEVLRHEIIHAFLYESGLDSNSQGTDSWARNEEMTDWLAIQSPKIFRVFKDLHLLDEDEVSVER